MQIAARIRPTRVPRRREQVMTMYCSYMKTLRPWVLLSPIALKQPYSQMFSLMFYVVETISKKKARQRAMAPTTPTKIWKSFKEDVTDFMANCKSSKTV